MKLVFHIGAHAFFKGARNRPAVPQSFLVAPGVMGCTGTAPGIAWALVWVLCLTEAHSPGCQVFRVRRRPSQGCLGNSGGLVYTKGSRSPDSSWKGSEPAEKGLDAGCLYSSRAAHSLLPSQNLHSWDPVIGCPEWMSSPGVHSSPALSLLIGTGSGYCLPRSRI